MTPKDAIDILKDIQNNLEEKDFIDRCAIDMGIKALEEQRPHGEWIIRRDKLGKHVYSVCSRCNVAHLDTDFPNFCENCGSDNRKRGETE